MFPTNNIVSVARLRNGSLNPLETGQCSQRYYLYRLPLTPHMSQSPRNGAMFPTYIRTQCNPKSMLGLNPLETGQCSQPQARMVRVQLEQVSIPSKRGNVPNSKPTGLKGTPARSLNPLETGQCSQHGAVSRTKAHRSVSIPSKRGNVPNQASVFWLP